MNATLANDWILPIHPVLSAPVRIVCLPPPGATAAWYRWWALDNAHPHADAAEIIAIQRPGRGSRLTESPITDLARLVRVTALQILSTQDPRPIVLFGYSSSSIYALDVGMALHRAGRTPVLLGVSASLPPNHPFWESVLPIVFGDPDKAVQRSGAERLLMAAKSVSLEARNTERAHFLVDLRLLLLKGHRSIQPVPFPISAFTAEDDPLTPPEETHGWQAWTTKAFIQHSYPGDHFYIYEHSAAVLTDLLSDIDGVRTAVPH